MIRKLSNTPARVNLKQPKINNHTFGSNIQKYKAITPRQKEITIKYIETPQPSGLIEGKVYSGESGAWINYEIDTSDRSVEITQEHDRNERLGGVEFRLSPEEQESVFLHLQSHYPQLAKLFMREGDLQAIPIAALFSGLTLLSIPNNKIGYLTLPSSQIHSKLESLYFSNNWIKQLDSRLPSQTPNLKELDLSNNYIEEFPISITGWRSLETLSLENNTGLRDIPDQAIPWLKSIKHLYIKSERHSQIVQKKLQKWNLI